MKRLLATSLLAVAAGLACAQDVVAPNANLKADGIPPIEKAIADKVALYTDFRGFSFIDWHPKERVMLVRHREAGANIAQIHLLRQPGGKLERVTDFAENVQRATFDPKDGKSIVYSRDAGGNEATQVFRMDLESRQSTLLSVADERSDFTWSDKGDRLLISAMPLDKTAKEGKRDDVRTTLTLLDPLHPDKKTKLAELPGGGWSDYRFSHGDKQLVALNYRTPNDGDVVLVDLKTGKTDKLLPQPGGPVAGYSGVAWSKDNRHLLLTSNQGGELYELALYDIRAKKLKPLSHHIPWDVDGFSVSKDGKRVFAVVNNNGRGEVHLFDAQTGKELARPDIPTGAIGGGKWHKTH